MPEWKSTLTCGKCTFVADGMLGKLSRWLRILGCDVEYRQDESDESLIETAGTSRRTLLTSDVQLYRQALKRKVDAFLVEGGGEAEMLAKISKRYNLKLKVDVEASRCPVCNSPLREAAGREVKGKVPPLTLRRHREFWLCTNTNCRKVYWQGSHWVGIKKILREAETYLK